MKKQWILIGIIAIALAIVGTTVSLNRGASETVLEAMTVQSPTPEKIKQGHGAQGPTLEQIEQDWITMYQTPYAAPVTTFNEVKQGHGAQGPSLEQIEQDWIMMYQTPYAVPVTTSDVIQYGDTVQLPDDLGWVGSSACINYY